MGARGGWKDLGEAQGSRWAERGGPGPRPRLLSTGDTYFFKGTHYWRFPKGTIKAEPDSPQPMGPKWLDCPAPSSGPHVPRHPKATPKSGTCDCPCEINKAAGRRPLPLLLSLLPLLAVGVAAC
ncbi:Matrix metalloproteinase-25 [Tupaia chinensis]|uniref:Matrix metalloproteinase-25 n=1 Tax=Tupaia chinensis TaxID=246437 RepID=L8YAP4_TUPCH|nr:Matrix metalloproteinase-25 [Tupaia chinensis]